MKSKYSIFLSGLLTMVALSGANPIAAQNKQKKAKVPVIEVHAQVTDATGKPLGDVAVLSGEGSIVNYTDKNGKFQVRTKADETLLIEAFGYKDAVVDLTKGRPSVIKLQSEDLYASERDMYERADGGNTSQRDLVGVVSKLSMDKVKKYPDLQLSNALQGQAAGLIAIAGEGGLGYNTSSLYVRGQHSNGNNTALVIIDGIERPIDDILPEEIESIEVLKDATAKVLYGAAATNGVVVIRTKRGEAYKRIFRVGVEFGVQPSTRTPKYLDSYNYATLFNEARMNDGMNPFYSDKQLEGYRNSTGVNDVLYPNVNFYDEFALNQSLYRKGTIEFNGGNEGVRYALTGGYTGGSGLEKVGDRSNLHRMNARGNLDIRITDYLTVTADVAARIELKNWGAVDGSGLFSYMAANRPNEYPFIIPNDAMKGQFTPNEDGTPFFGASTRVVDNLYANMQYGGTTTERYVNSQTNLGANFDFNKYVKGLTFDAYLTFDNYSYLSQALRNVYPTYAIDTYNDLAGNEVIRYTQMKKMDLPKKQNITGNNTYRYFGARANVGYTNTIGLHNFSAVAAFRYNKNEYTGMTQDFKDMNMSLRLNYGYDKRYLAEVTLSGMGSNKFDKDNRFFFSPAVGAAWILSNESFLEDAQGINFLKMKASFGILGYTGNTGFFLYQTGWNRNGAYNFYPDQTDRKVGLVRWGNPDLKWERSQEFNVGVEGLFLDNRLSAEVNYFHECRKDIIGVNDAAYSAVVGDYKMYENIGQVTNQGIDAAVNWNGTVGRDFSYSAGVNFTYSKNKLDKWNQPDGVEDYRKYTGRSTSTLYGLKALGLFGKDIALDGHPLQTFGIYQNGDIAYADMNGNGVVDSNDIIDLGQTFPMTTWGINVDLKYKGFGLYMLGTLNTGITKILPSYYWNNGLSGYSEVAFDRYHETNNPGGTMPRLTTTTGGNNYPNSTFWAQNCSYFRLKNVELSYTLDNKTGKGAVKNCRFFVRGTNLLTFSKMKDLDPERLEAGLTNYPAYATVTGGVSISF